MDSVKTRFRSEGFNASLSNILSNGIVIVVALQVSGMIAIDVPTFKMVIDEVQRAIPGEARVTEATFGTKTQFFTSILGESWLIASVITVFAPAHSNHAWATVVR
ncbi:hypothetical protein ASPCAL13037 [Aspergillus calidoustus]|jgi:hypothetical protein|uniref:Uncharacterized protein n=1 Tax=Aspergillus calidoustus TaxID=454130 RepID=A0A0U4ZK03_ASPCI|nr:hypothetical protein ASPCAL13037 [Aspergillus calidoustus]